MHDDREYEGLKNFKELISDDYESGLTIINAFEVNVVSTLEKIKLLLNQHKYSEIPQAAHKLLGTLYFMELPYLEASFRHFLMICNTPINDDIAKQLLLEHKELSGLFSSYVNELHTTFRLTE